jgi:hypothetical protein
VVPDAVLMILSGQADLSSTIKAVNSANLFRFLTKPCDPDDLSRALDGALRQHRLVLAERELLQQTVTGAVDVLTDVLSMASPGASRRTERVRSIVLVCAEALGLDDDWRLPVAAMLSHLGCIAVPGPVIDRLDAGQELDPTAQQMWDGHPQAGRGLLVRIPRLEQVAEWVGAQPTRQDQADAAGPGPTDDVAACVLTAVAAFLVHQDRGDAPREITRRLEQTGRYPAAVLEAVLVAVDRTAPRGVLTEVKVTGLMSGMVIHQDVTTSTGMILVRAGERVTDVLISRLINFSRSVGVQEPIQVLVQR